MSEGTSTFQKNNEAELEKARQQFQGFIIGASSGCVVDLIRSMALTEEEWNELKKDGAVSGLDGFSFDLVEKYFDQEQNND